VHFISSTVSQVNETPTLNDNLLMPLGVLGFTPNSLGSVAIRNCMCSLVTINYFWKLHIVPKASFWIFFFCLTEVSHITEQVLSGQPEQRKVSPSS
jgi:hypothetical protein